MAKKKKAAKKKAAPKADADEEQVPVPKSDLVALNSIREKAGELEKAEEKLDKAADAHKAAKAERDEIRDSLVALCHGQDLGGPLVGLMEEDGWKRVPLPDVVGADFSTLIMDRAGSNLMPRATLGHLASFLQDRPLTELRSVGPAKADKIMDRMFAWWMKHPEWAKPESLGSAR